METMTKDEAQMVVEHFAQEAAQEAPDTTDWRVWDRHMWMTRYETSLAIERQIGELDWDQLVNAQINLQSFNRSPLEFMFDHGYEDKSEVQDYLEDTVSTHITLCVANSAA